MPSRPARHLPGRPVPILVLLLGCTAWLFASASPVAQEAPGSGRGARSATDAATDAADDAAARAARDARVTERLLHAARGGVLRATSRFRDDHWEYRDGDGWHALPPQMITSARPLAEVLEAWGKARAGVDRDDLPGRVAVAAWGLDEGLYEEALQQLDAVLEAEPDQPEALALLHRDDLPLAIPSPHAGRGADGLGAAPSASATAGREASSDPDEAARERLLEFAASTPPALREMAIERMRELSGPDAARLRTMLGDCLTHPEAGRRAMAALALRRLDGVSDDGLELSTHEVEELLRRAVRDVAEAPRRQAALTLRDTREPALMLPVLRALESESAALRTHAAEALGLMGHAEAVEPLVQRLLTLPATGGSGGFHAPRAHIFVGRQIAFVQDFDVDIAQNAAIGDPQIGTLQEGATLDVRVFGASTSGGSYNYAREAAAIRSSLERLTGVRAGSTKSAWKAWWAAHQEQWPRAGDLGAAAGGPEAAPGTPAGG